MSGVKLTEECQKTYQSIQKDKSHRYAIFKIADGQICLDKVRWREGEGNGKGGKGPFTAFNAPIDCLLPAELPALPPKAAACPSPLLPDCRPRPASFFFRPAN